jgi:Tol biopolymer transport system component
VSDTPFPFPTSRFVDSASPAPLNLQGKFVFSPGDGSIWIQEAGTGTTTALISRSLKALAQLPAFSPDGKRIAYAELVFLAGGVVRGDIRVMDADGKNDRVVLQGAGANDYYFYPRWTADGQGMLVTHAQNIQTLDERDQLERVDLATKASVRRIVEDGRDADISLDGHQIVFIRAVPDGSTNSLWMANADGSAPQNLVANGVFTAIMSPRFSPDGKWLAFSVHGSPRQSLPLLEQASKPQPETTVRDDESCFLYVLVTCLVQTASAHGAPGAIWRVNLASRRFEQITPIYQDSPTPAWSADGTTIALQDVSSIRLIELAQHAVYPVDLKHGGTGGFDWKEKISP